MMKYLKKLSISILLILALSSLNDCKKKSQCWYCETWGGAWGQGHQGWTLCDSQDIEYAKSQMNATCKPVD